MKDGQEPRGASALRPGVRVDDDALCQAAGQRATRLRQGRRQLQTGRAELGGQPEVLERLVDAREEEGGDLVVRQLGQRVAVLLVEVAPAVGTALGVDGESGHTEREEVAEDRPA